MPSFKEERYVSMKTNIMGTVLGIALTATLLHSATLARADQPAEAKGLAAKGTISAVNATDRTVTVSRLLGHRTFNLANDCAISIGNKQDATLADLKPTMQVEVSYVKANGVFVANRIRERQRTFTGSIQTLDPKDQMLVLKRDRLNTHFRIGDQCRFLGRNDQPATLGDLKVGQHVTVRYVKENGVRIAEQIEQPSSTVVGTIEALDAVNGTAKARVMLSSKQFVLASDCTVLNNGKPGGQLRDLRLGEKVAIDYRDVDGVLVATRIAPVEAGSSAMTEPAQRAAK